MLTCGDTASCGAESDLGSRVLPAVTSAHLKTERLLGHAVGDGKITLHRTTEDVFK